MIAVPVLAQHTRKVTKAFDQDRPKPPISPPKCSGNIDYKWLEMGEFAPITGILFTEDASNCVLGKYTWCVEAWHLQIKTSKKKCDNEKTLLTESLKLDLKNCSKVKTKLTQALEKKNKWYNSPYLWGAVGLVAGAALATGISIAVTR